MPHRDTQGRRMEGLRGIHMQRDIPVGIHIWAVTPADIRTAWGIPEGTLRGCRRGIRRALRAAG